MSERKVDILDKAGKVLHTYPITLDASNPHPKDADYEKAALAAARTAKLVPEAEFGHLKAHLHAAAAHAAA